MTSFISTCHYELRYFVYYLQSFVDKPLYGKNDSAADLAIMYFVLDRDIEFIKYLVTYKGAEINSIDWYGSSPLHMAAALQEIQIADYLLANGANVDIKDIRGHTPLYYSARLGSIKSVKFLLEKGADVNADDKILIDLFSKLFDLKIGKYIQTNVQENSVQILKLLIEYGVDFSPVTALLANQGIALTENQQQAIMTFLTHNTENQSVAPDNNSKITTIDNTSELVEHLDSATYQNND